MSLGRLKGDFGDVNRGSVESGPCPDFSGSGLLPSQSSSAYACAAAAARGISLAAMVASQESNYILYQLDTVGGVISSP
jgi:hypothetical protein